MNVVPAQVAGVSSIAVTSPPQLDNGGWPDAGVLAACAMLGVTEVYAAGGAQGIALLGLGSKDDPVVEPVDVITGPGNIYVTAAKRRCGAGWPSIRSRPDRDRWSWLTIPPIRSTSPPT